MLVLDAYVNDVDVGDQNGWNRHQHISTSTSITNIDVTHLLGPC